MEQGNTAGMANYVNRAADQLDRWSETLRNRELDDMARDVRRLAREQPALFIGAAFAIGVLTSRFLKSSSERARPHEQGAMQEPLSGAWTTSTPGSTTTRPSVAHDMPGTAGTSRVTDSDIDLERP